MYIYFGTLDNTFSFYIGCSDWHYEVFLLPTKRLSVVRWDSLSHDGQIFLRDKNPDAGQGAVCDLCVRSARPSVFFSRHSSSTSSSAPQSVDSGLQVPSGLLVVSGAATSLATESVESGVVEPLASVAESSTAATGPATGSLQIDYCRPALVAEQSHRVCCTPTQHTVRWEWEACVQSSFPASFVCAVKTIFLLRTSDKKCKKQCVLELNRFVGFLFGHFVLLTCWGFWLLHHRRLFFLDQGTYHWTTG